MKNFYLLSFILLLNSCFLYSMESIRPLDLEESGVYEIEENEMTEKSEQKALLKEKQEEEKRKAKERRRHREEAQKEADRAKARRAAERTRRKQ